MISFLTLYKNYKKDPFPVIMIGMSIIIVLFLIFFELPILAEKRSILETKKNEEEQLRASYLTLTLQQDQDLAGSLALAKTALPDTKDIVSIFNTLSMKASQDRIELSSFSLKVGDVYSTKKQGKVPLSAPPYLAVVVDARSAQAQNLTTFADDVAKSLPLVDVAKISLNDDRAQYEFNFHYKPINLQEVTQQRNIAPLTADDQAVLEKLKKLK